MSPERQELEPRIAAHRALDALFEAGKYSGYGLTTVGTRVGRRAAAAGAEGARGRAAPGRRCGAVLRRRRGGAAARRSFSS